MPTPHLFCESELHGGMNIQLESHHQQSSGLKHYQSAKIRLTDTLQNKLANFEGENIIIRGDFNIPLDPKVDKKGGNSDFLKHEIKNGTKQFLAVLIYAIFGD